MVGGRCVLCRKRFYINTLLGPRYAQNTDRALESLTVAGPQLEGQLSMRMYLVFVIRRPSASLDARSGNRYQHDDE